MDKINCMTTKQMYLGACLVCACMCALCVDRPAFAEKTPESEPTPQMLGFGLGLGMHYLPTFRLEWRPLPWFSVAGRLGGGVNGYKKRTGDDGISDWYWRHVPSITTGIQFSGILPIGNGHQIAARVGFDWGLPLGQDCTSSNPPSCSPSWFMLLDASAGWAWQSGAWEIRADIGAARYQGIEDGPYEKAGEPFFFPTAMLTGVYWFL
jgi:hypothetical protein